uniref:Uncharacterized protein n=2 Tax=Auxenochlorella protothecoides TaxID=3075 RepID=A0A1D2A708_AUXPR
MITLHLSSSGPLPPLRQRAPLHERPGALRNLVASHGQQAPMKRALHRRPLLLLPLLTPLLLAMPNGARAAQSPNEAPPAQYYDLADRLVSALGAALDTEESGASESALRRSADPARAAIREFTADWASAAGDASHVALSAAIRELAEHYRREGQRARLPRQVVQSIRQKLEQARQAVQSAPSRQLLVDGGVKA